MGDVSPESGEGDIEVSDCSFQDESDDQEYNDKEGDESQLIEDSSVKIAVLGGLPSNYRNRSL